MFKTTIFKSSDENVSKFVFETNNFSTSKDIAIEAVLYKYNSYKERTVICCSTQCGCPVGCSFCGTGKFFIRNLHWKEIVQQVVEIVNTLDCKPEEIEKFQIMFMSMGEPFLNYYEVKLAILKLHEYYPNAQLLISTSAPVCLRGYLDDFIKLSKQIDKVGLQFSVHESTNEARAKLIPTNTSSLREISRYGEQWASFVGRQPYFNYCVHKNNSSNEDVQRLKKYFNPDIWQCTLSVICEKDSSMKAAINNQLELINNFKNKLIEQGFSLRVFNPAGQDDIGGGCGQLWYFQEWLENKKV